MPWHWIHEGLLKAAFALGLIICWGCACTLVYVQICYTLTSRWYMVQRRKLHDINRRIGSVSLAEIDIEINEALGVPPPWYARAMNLTGPLTDKMEVRCRIYAPMGRPPRLIAIETGALKSWDTGITVVSEKFRQLAGFLKTLASLTWRILTLRYWPARLRLGRKSTVPASPSSYMICPNCQHSPWIVPSLGTLPGSGSSLLTPAPNYTVPNGVGYVTTVTGTTGTASTYLGGLTNASSLSTLNAQLQQSTVAGAYSSQLTAMQSLGQFGLMGQLGPTPPAEPKDPAA